MVASGITIKDRPEPRPINGNWELRCFNSTVRRAIDDLERFGRPKAQGGLQDEEAAEQTRATKNREQKKREVRRQPIHFQTLRSPDKNDQPLREPTDSSTEILSRI